MDGIIAQIDQICDLADKYDALVMVDDCHATGFVGKQDVVQQSIIMHLVVWTSSGTFGKLWEVHQVDLQRKKKLLSY